MRREALLLTREGLVLCQNWIVVGMPVLAQANCLAGCRSSARLAGRSNGLQCVPLCDWTVLGKTWRDVTPMHKIEVRSEQARSATFTTSGMAGSGDIDRHAHAGGVWWARHADACATDSRATDSRATDGCATDGNPNHRAADGRADPGSDGCAHGRACA
jgi:hypothetical protein